jgi:hypothetical protein
VIHITEAPNTVVQHDPTPLQQGMHGEVGMDGHMPPTSLSGPFSDKEHHMYLYNRISTAHPDRYRDSVSFALSISKKVESLAGISVSVYSTLFGGPVSTLSWGTVFGSLGELETMREKLADPSYAAEVDKARGLFDGPPTDNLLKIISSDFDTNPKRFYSGVIARVQPAKTVEAMALGIEIQKLMGSVSGAQSLFGATAFGESSCGWIMGANSLAEIETATSKGDKDKKFQQLVADFRAVVVPGTTSRNLVERIG